MHWCRTASIGRIFQNAGKIFGEAPRRSGDFATRALCLGLCRLGEASDRLGSALVLEALDDIDGGYMYYNETQVGERL